MRRRTSNPIVARGVTTGAILVCLTTSSLAQRHGPPAEPDDAIVHAEPPTVAALLHSTGHMPMCFPADISAAELQRLIDEWGLRPPSMLHDHPSPRFFNDAFAWTGVGQIGPSDQGARAHLRYSFPDDGVQWGLASIHAPSVGPNDLNARLVTTFGDLDRGREFIRQALASWRRHVGVSYTEIADDNAPMDDFEFPIPSRGDIRIGGAPASGSGFLAYNAFPSAAGGLGLVGGGDMFIATNNFTILNFNNPANGYRLFRNTVAHENGHGLGLFHVVPCTQTKLMEPQIATAFDGITIDEMRGGARNYGDRYSGNHLPADAHQIGDLSLPGPRSVLLDRVALNGATGPNGTHTDFYQFRISTPRTVTVFAAPTGGSYDNGMQTTACNGAHTVIDASFAGDLELELIDLNTGVSMYSNNSGHGGGETITVAPLPAGDYLARVTDIGPNSNQIVQLYNFGVLVDFAEYLPVAIAGINKRCKGNEPCWFMGDINSYTLAPGAVISSYDWDIDGDGVTDVSGPGSFSFNYPSSGDYTVTLRVTDHVGSSEDTIRVTVHGAQIVLNAMTPNSAYRGQTVTSVIDGANFNIPTSLTLSGSGWTASSMTSTHPLGLQAEVTIQIDPLATPGLRAVRITNADGVITVTDAFEVLVCDGDTNGDGVVDFADFSAVLAAYGACAGDPAYNPAADFNNDGCVDFTDFSIVLANYGTVCF